MKQCIELDCEREHYARGWCKMHYNKFRKDAQPLAYCITSGCGNRAYRAKNTRCHLCYEAIQRGKDPEDRKSVGVHSGKRFKTKSGYIAFFAPSLEFANPNGNTLEHRYVMARHLGRDLLRSETVHHKNGDRSDNRIENLELWSTSQPPGQRVEDKVQWAIEILDLYQNFAHLNSTNKEN